MAKKDNTLLYVGAGAAAYYLYARGAYGQIPATLDPKNLLGSVDKAIRIVANWDLTKISKETATDVAKKALTLSAQGRNLAQQISEGVDPANKNWLGIGGAGAHLATQAFAPAVIHGLVYNLNSSIDQMKYLEDQLRGYMANAYQGLIGADRAQSISLQLLKNARASIVAYETYKDSIFSKIVSALTAFNKALGDILNALKDFAGGVWDFAKYLPGIVLIVGGMYVYNNFVKDK